MNIFDIWQKHDPEPFKELLPCEILELEQK